MKRSKHHSLRIKSSIKAGNNGPKKPKPKPSIPTRPSGPAGEFPGADIDALTIS